MLGILLITLVCGILSDLTLAEDNAETLRAKKAIPSSCTAKYRSLKASTMCEYRDDPAASHTGVNPVLQIVIVADHNKYRRAVRRPRAANLQKMYWDPEIAAIAQKWANTCPNGHDTSDNRQVPGYGIHIGQNWAAGYRTWDRAIKAWYDEVDLYRYGENPDHYLPNGFMDIGHYTQVVRDIAARVGCGYAECPRLGNVYVCNYAFGNPVDWGKPYEGGSPCGACPKSCKKNLCDCAGKICKNGGTLDPNTCRCSCPDLWTGEECGQLSCPARDPEVCGAAWGYSLRRCDEWINVPEECPYMCGVCSSDDVPGPNSALPPGDQAAVKNALSKVAKTPTSSGLPTCTQVDQDYCGKPQPYGFEQKHCRLWINVPEECPAMCGRCAAKCPGLTGGACANGGTLLDDCSCACAEGFTGAQCKKFVKCPRPKDEFWCDQFTRADCKKYFNFATDCPYMCQTC